MSAFVSGGQIRQIVFERIGVLYTKIVSQATSTKEIVKNLNDAIEEFDLDFKFKVANGNKVGTFFVGGTELVRIVTDGTTIRDELGLDESTSSVIISPRVPFVFPDVAPARVSPSANKQIPFR
jgi:hypothetical protein